MDEPAPTTDLPVPTLELCPPFHNPASPPASSWGVPEGQAPFSGPDPRRKGLRMPRPVPPGRPPAPTRPIGVRTDRETEPLRRKPPAHASRRPREPGIARPTESVPAAFAMAQPCAMIQIGMFSPGPSLAIRSSESAGREIDRTNEATGRPGGIIAAIEGRVNEAIEALSAPRVRERSHDHPRRNDRAACIDLAASSRRRGARERSHRAGAGAERTKRRVSAPQRSYHFRGSCRLSRRRREYRGRANERSCRREGGRSRLAPILRTK